MLLTSSSGLGDFDFREKKKYTKNFIYSSEFRWKMRPRYAFDTKKPTKSDSYQKPTKIWNWSQNGTRIKFKRKRLPRFTAKQPRMKIIINLKTNNYVINKKPFFWMLSVECWMLNVGFNVECWMLSVECWFATSAPESVRLIQHSTFNIQHSLNHSTLNIQHFIKPYLFFINWLALFRLSCSPSRPYILILALIGSFKRWMSAFTACRSAPTWWKSGWDLPSDPLHR